MNEDKIPENMVMEEDDINHINEIIESNRIKNENENHQIKKENVSIRNEEIPVESVGSKDIIGITSIINWMRRYRNFLPPEVKTINLEISGVNKDEFLMLRIPHYKNGQTKLGESKKDLILLKNANKIPVLNLPIIDIYIYDSGIRMYHSYKGYILKVYCGKPNNLYVSSANEHLIPYAITRLGNSTNGFYFNKCTINIEEKLSGEIDRDIIISLYDVIKNYKYWANVKTVADACKYFLEIQKNIKDTAHYIKIDNIMIGMITGKYPILSNVTHVEKQIIHEG